MINEFRYSPIWESSSEQYEEIIKKYAEKMDDMFTSGSNEKTAVLNWRMMFSDRDAKFIEIGESYINAAFHLVNCCLYNNADKKADALIFPILFCLVEGIEVYLKAIRDKIWAYLKIDKKITAGSHDLRVIINDIKSHSCDCFSDKSEKDMNEIITACNLVGNFIDNIYKHYDDMFFMRYPEDRTGKAYSYATHFSENEYVNLELLKKELQYVYAMLEFLYISCNELKMENV